MAEKSKRLKALLEAPEILVIPGIYDGYSARLVEASGFAVAAISGAGVSESHLGCADTGYGNATTVHFTVRAFEAAGVAALMLEDQVWPKRCGHMDGKQVVSEAEMVQKIKAACDARIDDDFIIRARTDAAGPLGLNAAIDRLNAYAEAGADTVFADALLSAEDIEQVARNVPKPLTVNMGLGIRARPTTPLIHPAKLQAMGVAAVSYPRLLSTAAVRGMMNAMDAFKDMLGGTEAVDRPDLLVGFDEINKLTGFDQLSDLDETYAHDQEGSAHGHDGD